MKIVMAPNAFKNSLPASEVAAALVEGFQKAGFKGAISNCPVGDGGDGTGTLLCRYFNAIQCYCNVKDPLGRPIQAPWGWIPEKQTAIIEMADASGLRLLKPEAYAPLKATTAGCGQLIKAALDKKAKEIILCIGGSATVDGGSGILKELGIVFYDKNGNSIEDLPMGLQNLEAVSTTGLDSRLAGTGITILCDVKNKLLGTAGAAAVFGPQKGAAPQDVAELEKALARLDAVTEKATGIQMRALVSGGAAGGIAAALAAYCNAAIVQGIDYFLELTGFGQQLEKADWVITGEGTIDQQTLDGKAPFGVAKMAMERGVKVIVVAGKIPEKEDRELAKYFNKLICINEPGTSLSEALPQTYPNLVKTGSAICRQIMQQGSIPA
ncbi:MAG: glycerate kinase [Niabella sp.]